MKLEHKKELKQVLNPVQYQNISKEDNFMYKIGVKAGYRLALQQINKGRDIVVINKPIKYTSNKYKTVDIQSITDPIIKRACQLLNVSHLSLLSKTRFRMYVMPRSIIINVLRCVTDLSTPQIGLALNRDHTTILHHLRSKEHQEYFWKKNNQKTYNIFNQLVSEFKASEISD